MGARLLLGAACALLVVSVILQALNLNRDVPADSPPSLEQHEPELARIEAMTRRLEDVSERLALALKAWHGPAIAEEPGSAASDQPVADARREEVPVASLTTPGDDAAHGLADLKSALEREVASLREELRTLVGLIGSGQPYGELKWENLASRPQRTPSQEEMRAIRIGTPFHVVIDQLGLPAEMSGSFYDSLAAKWPHPSGDKKLGWLVEFGGGLVTNKFPRSINVR
ncbi:MAG: hypothetical protein HY812_00630 [Planctomycetes bacterium]|nr:hypothetical protein [Planctomycetota bacterium]